MNERPGHSHNKQQIVRTTDYFINAHRLGPQVWATTGTRYRATTPDDFTVSTGTWEIAMFKSGKGKQQQKDEARDACQMRPEIADALRTALSVHDVLQGRRAALREAIESGDTERTERCARALLGMV